MTNVSKCLVVFFVVASLGFLAAVSISAVGGPNYEGELDDPEFSQFTFEKSIDEATGEVTWTAVTDKEMYSVPGDPRSEFGRQTAAENTKVLPAAMIKALEMTQGYQRVRIDELDSRIESLTTKVAEAKQANGADLKALQARLDGLIEELERKNKELAAVQADIADTKLKDLKKREEAKRRRDDIERLKNQIDILEADKVRLDEQQRKLVVLLKQLDGTVRRLRDRNRQLREQVQLKKPSGKKQ